MIYYFYFLAYDTTTNPTKWRVDYEEQFSIDTGIGNTREMVNEAQLIQGIAIFRSHTLSFKRANRFCSPSFIFENILVDRLSTINYVNNYFLIVID